METYRSTSTAWNPLNRRAGINLEMALIIAMLILVAVATLGFMGVGIQNRYTSGVGALDVAGAVSGPTGAAGTDNGDGTYTLSFSGGTPPYTISSSPNADMSGATVVGSTSSTSYAVSPAAGSSYYQVVDANSAELTQPVVLTLPTLQRYEQDSALITKGGTWSTLSNASYSGASALRCATAGGTMTFTFAGDRVDLIALRGSSSGILGVSVDGGATTQVDLYAASTSYKATVWSNGYLSNGTHTVLIQFTGAKNASSTSTAVNVDAIDVWGSLQ